MLGDSCEVKRRFILHETGFPCYKVFHFLDDREKLHHCKRVKIVLWEDKSLLALNSLYEEKGNDGTYGAKHKLLTSCATRTIILRRENVNYLIVCITQRTLFFQHVSVFCCQYVCCTLSVENVCNETSWQVTKDRMSIKKTTCLQNKIVFHNILSLLWQYCSFSMTIACLILDRNYNSPRTDQSSLTQIKISEQIKISLIIISIKFLLVIATRQEPGC